MSPPSPPAPPSRRISAESHVVGLRYERGTLSGTVTPAPILGPSAPTGAPRRSLFNKCVVDFFWGDFLHLQAVNKFLPRSGLADFYPVIPGTLGSATRKALLQQVKAARQKLVVRWAQATTEVFMTWA